MDGAVAEPVGLASGDRVAGKSVAREAHLGSWALDSALGVRAAGTLARYQPGVSAEGTGRRPTARGLLRGPDRRFERRSRWRWGRFCRYRGSDRWSGSRGQLRHLDCASCWSSRPPGLDCAGAMTGMAMVARDS